MPRKIAVDLEYESIRTFWSDVRLLGELALLIIGKSYRRDATFSMPLPNLPRSKVGAVPN
jgi:hypothetical protein